MGREKSNGESTDAKHAARWITVGVAARILGMSVDKVRRLIESGNLRTAERIGAKDWRKIDSQSVKLLKGRINSTPLNR